MDPDHLIVVGNMILGIGTDLDRLMGGRFQHGTAVTDRDRTTQENSPLGSPHAAPRTGQLGDI